MDREADPPAGVVAVEAAAASDLDLPIPSEGLGEVLSSWSGRGQVFAALSGVAAESQEQREWSQRDIERRAARVLFGALTPHLARWPLSPRVWEDALPAETAKRRELAPAITAPVLWRETRRSGLWPPREYVVRPANRVADTLLVTTLRWTLESLLATAEIARRTEASSVLAVGPQLDVARVLLARPPVNAAEPVPPGHAEIRSLAREGRPWNGVAKVADELRAYFASPLELAYRFLLPDPDLRWRLFHLAIMGVVVHSLRAAGLPVISGRPLSGGSVGPAYRTTTPRGEAVEVWFEAGAVWRHHGLVAPYVDATLGLPSAIRPLAPDILLLVPGGRAMVLECKYSSNAETIGHRGYLQAAAYSLELHSTLAREVEAWVVSPSGTLPSRSMAKVETGTIGLLPLDELRLQVRRFLHV